MADFAPAAPLDRFILRGSPPFAVAVPTHPLHSLSLGGASALWLGPDEWLLLAPEGEGAALAAQVARTETPHALFDVSHRQLGFVLSGEDAATLLNGAVPLDLSPEAFPVGMCTRTLFEKAEIVLWRTAASAWHIDVARSFAEYFQELLAVIAQADGIALA
ncbi:MAG: sarcosine oxidase subunit gamma [Proteobacteria bacterium]|nr:sarcosine oxidase subunit gamma [Pseudomonadota bacterium]